MSDGRLPPSWPAVAAGVVAGAVTVLYVVVQVQQGGWSRTPAVAAFFTVLLGLAAVGAFLGAFLPRAGQRVVVLAAVSAELFVLGVLALASVGVLLLLAGTLALVGLLGLRGQPR